MFIKTSVLALCAAGAAAAAAAGGVDRFAFSRVKTESSKHPTKGYTVHTDTFYSIPMELAPGEMVFTNSDTTPLVMPDAKLSGYAILGFGGEIVGGNNESAPLSECYDHHWIAVQDRHENPFECGPNYIVGIGAESRNTKDIFPDGYGYHVKPLDNKFGANIHLLHTVGLEGDDVYRATKECNECYYAPTKGSECTVDQNGTFDCCGDYCPAHECFCPTKNDVDMTATTTYRLKYQVNYTYDVSQITPINVGTITTPNCQTFYGVYENDDEPENLARSEYHAPADVELVYAVGHQHVGALNISLFVNDKFVCASYPRYGQTPGKAGDEQGYVVEMSTCLDKDTTGSLQVNKGDKVRLDSWYWVGRNDTRIYPRPGGTHLNVMGYMYMGFVEGSPGAVAV